ncbi:MAG: hypothetical protein DRQ40_09855, partial [Gammaproteobacteria bacterium]
MTQVSDWIKESCTTVGTGVLTLIGSEEGFTRFGSAFSTPRQVWYVILDGINRETGVGTFNGVSSITRDTINSTLVGGVFNNTNPTAIYLNGSSVVACAFSADAYLELISLIDDVAADLVVTNANVAANATNIANNAGSIAINTADIADNANAIIVNENGIAANVTNIETNATNIALNTDAIDNLIIDSGQHSMDIAANADDIDALEIVTADNQVAITINKADIATNTGNIATNTGDIATNAADIVRIDDDVSYREVSITALESGGYIEGNGATTILIAAGQGEIIDSYSDTENQSTKEISWLEQSFDLLANAGMPVVIGIGYTEIGIDKASAGDGTGIPKAFPNGISDSLRRTTIRLGAVEYLDQVITDVSFIPVVSNQVGNVMMDLISFTSLDTRVKDMLLRPTEIGDLTVWRDSGSFFQVGANYTVALDDQNVAQVPVMGAIDDAILFRPLLYTGGTTSVGLEITLIPDEQYEPDPVGGSGLQTVSNGKTVIHYMMQTVSGTTYLSYGQQQYDSYDEAKGTLFADRASHLFPVETSNMLLLAQIVIAKGASVWGATAEIFPLGSAVSSGSSGGSSTNALNISYTDTYALGTNVQVAIDSLAALKLTPDQHDAIAAGQAPSGTNEFITESAMQTPLADKADVT